MKATNEMNDAYRRTDFDKFKSSIHDVIRKGGVAGAAGNIQFREAIAGVAKDMNIKIDGKEVTATSLGDKNELAKLLGKLDHTIQAGTSKF